MNPLLRPLCDEFRLDYHAITHIEQVEMLYIYERLAQQMATEDFKQITREINALRKQLRAGGRTRSLYTIFRYIQANEMTESGRYDFNTLRPPRSSFSNQL